MTQVTTATTLLVKPTVLAVTQPIQAVHLGEFFTPRKKYYFSVSNATKSAVMSAQQASSFSNFGISDIINKESNSRPSSAAPPGAPASTSSQGSTQPVVRCVLCLKSPF